MLIRRQFDTTPLLVKSGALHGQVSPHMRFLQPIYYEDAHGVQSIRWRTVDYDTWRRDHPRVLGVVTFLSFLAFPWATDPMVVFIPEAVLRYMV